MRARKASKRKPVPGALWLHPKLQPLPFGPHGPLVRLLKPGAKPDPVWAPFDLPGPLVRLPGGTLMTVGRTGVMTSRDRGRKWTEHPLFTYGPNDKEYKISNERVLFRTAKGTLILSFLNLNERVWLWRNELKDALPGTRCPNYITRSTDNGRTWQTPVMLHEDWTGELRNIIQTRSGRIVLSSMKFLHNPGRHSVLTYSSGDDGQTWTPSHLIDLGGCGHHGGVTEATIEELTDGRLLMLLRTNWGRFWQAFSEDEGQSWRDIGPTAIDASSAPGLLKRLASGRLLLIWNRQYPEGKPSFPRSGGDGIWSEVPVSNHREELSIAFSEDDGATFSDPVVIARRKNAWLSYPRVLEYSRGLLWLTTMQGPVRAAFRESDFA
ncbi:MAG: hypothetical protein A2269_05015 [Lentisphaerae bacterium RIFOXYA12_FULL_60_10]|nr:MAG: hypothetical protein A2269_05015 [Lentisphaerae bacterium RIFOXYA12_FULL_60_10]